MHSIYAMTFRPVLGLQISMRTVFPVGQDYLQVLPQVDLEDYPTHPLVDNPISVVYFDVPTLLPLHSKEPCCLTCMVPHRKCFPNLSASLNVLASPMVLHAVHQCRKNNDILLSSDLAVSRLELSCWLRGHSCK